MALENPLNNDSGVAAPPTNAPPTTAPPPQVETTSAPMSDTLTPPAAPQPVPQLSGSQVQPQESAPTRHPSFMAHLGPSLVGAVLSNLTGPHQAIDHYETDDSGKQKAIMRDLHPRERLQRLAQAALEGLAAGSRVGPQQSRGAAWAAGLGAGAEQSIASGQQQDLLKRQQAKEDFEAGEKAKTDNAVRAMHIASAFALRQKAVQEAEDRDPEFQRNKEIVNNAQDFADANPDKLTVKILNPEQANLLHQQELAALKNDPSHKTKLSVPYQLGLAPAKDDQGNTLYESDGVTPVMKHQIAMINGSAIPVSQGWADDVKKYGPLAGIRNATGLSEGLKMPLTNFLSMDAKINGVKHQEIEGWKNAKILKRPDGTEVLVNPITNAVREAPNSTGSPSINLQQIQNELSKGATGERAAEIAAGLQTQIDDPATPAATKASLQKLQTQASTQAQASTKFATTKAAAVTGAEAKAKQQVDTKPVYAITTDVQGNQRTVMTTVAQAQQQNMTGIRPVKQMDISKDQHDIKVLNDIQVKSNNVRAAASVMDRTSWTDSGAIAKYLTDNPNTTLNQLTKSSVFGHASPKAVAYAIAINSLRESAMGLQKVLTGTARTNETQLQALQNTLPGVEPTSGIVGQKLDAFDQNLVMLGQGLPENTGVQMKIGRQGQTQNPAQNPAQTVHKVGDQITQNGHTFTVTGVDANGRVTGAQ
jgi:hypothetical protein